MPQQSPLPDLNRDTVECGGQCLHRLRLPFRQGGIAAAPSIYTIPAVGLTAFWSDV